MTCWNRYGMRWRDCVLIIFNSLVPIVSEVPLFLCLHPCLSLNQYMLCFCHLQPLNPGWHSLLPQIINSLLFQSLSRTQMTFSQFSSVAQSCPTLWDPMNRSTPGLPVHHQLPEFTQTHVHQVGDVIQSSHLLLSPSPPAPNPSQHQGLFQWVNLSHEVAKVLEFQLQHQSSQWTPRTDLL